MRKIFLLSVLIFYVSLSQAHCNEVIEELAKTLHLNTEFISTELSNCKIWPYAPDKRIVVITLPSPQSDKPIEGITYNDMVVAIVDSKTNELLTHLYEKKAFNSAAIFADAITIDTARYQLNATTRAFGVRFHQRNLSRYNSYDGESLSLYYLQNKELHSAMKGLSMSDSYSNWDENCEGQFKDIERTLVITKTSQKKFNNLKINEVIIQSILKPIKPDDCDKIVKSSKNRSFALRHNGSEYKIPQKYLADIFYSDW